MTPSYKNNEEFSVSWTHWRAYLTSKDNEDLLDYKGDNRASFNVSYQYFKLTGWIMQGRDRSRVTKELSLQIYPLIDVRMGIMFQYFDGYGERILDYYKKTTEYRIGVSLW